MRGLKKGSTHLLGAALAGCFALGACLGLAACLERNLGGGSDSTHTYEFELEERELDDRYLAAQIDVEGVVLDETHAGLEGVRADLIGWGEAASSDGRTAVTDAEGRYTLLGLARRSLLVRLSKDGYYDEILPLDVQRPLGEDRCAAETVVLVRRRASLLRLLIAGDSMFGRRYLDRDEDGIEGEPGDLIRPESISEDSRLLLRFLRDTIGAADYAVVNFESPVRRFAQTVHPYKTYTFFSYPESLDALRWGGVDAVSLGNNHVYDYLEEGMEETLACVEAAGLDWFGAGMSEREAQASSLSRSLNGVDFALQGFNGILPYNFPPGTPDPWRDEYFYIAMDDPEKGGALALNKDNVRDFLDEVRETRFSIPVLHGGGEYGEYPSSNMRAQILAAMKSGAGFVAAHHSHTLYGVAVFRSGDGPRFALLSLGNFLFDQDVFETFQSCLAVVDVEQLAEGRHRLRRISLLPMHIERYVPKLVCGEWAACIGRHVGHLSSHLPALLDAEGNPDGLEGAVVFPAGGRAIVCSGPSEYQVSETLSTVSAELMGGESRPLCAPRSEPGDMVARIQTSRPAVVEAGRELMHYGDFEDLDVDDEFHEGSLWNQSASAFVENSVVRSGIGSMVFLRLATSKGPVSTWLKNRVTFAAGLPLTLAAHTKGQNAGAFEVHVRWYRRGARDVIATEVVHAREGGSWEWESFSVDLDAPAEAGTVRAYFYHHPPEDGEGRLFLDDVSLIQWEHNAGDAHLGVDLSIPNNWSWIRLRELDPPDSPVGVTLIRHTYRPRPAQP